MNKIIPSKFVLTLIMGLLISMFVFTGCGQGTSTTQTYEWPHSGLAASVPKPANNNGEISTDDETSFTFYIYNATWDDYDSYVKACKERGFTEVDEKSGDFYSAYNIEGDRHISVDYYEDDKELFVEVNAPETWSEIYWPKNKLGKSLPEPENLYGIVNSDYSDRFDLDIANVSVQQFNQYIDQCIDAGYDVDYRRYEDSFSAKNKDGYELDIDYELFNVMSISADMPEEE